MAEGDGRRTFLIGQAEMPARPLSPALYLVATPIGNLGDMTLRGLETIAACDILACEDTRVTRTLLARYGIRQRPVPYHEHNAAEAGPRLLAALSAGGSVALVSDAGTPLVSDPGFRLVEAAREAGIAVVPIPGASAVLTALTASGLPTDAFFFGGFLPVKQGARASRLAELAAIPGTLVFFESPNRLAASLAAMLDVLGDRHAAICRELTKTFEEFRTGGLSALSAHYAEAGAPRGEVVVCVAPPGASPVPDAGDVDALLLSLAAELGASKAAAEAARQTGLKKSDLYRRLMELKADGEAGAERDAGRQRHQQRGHRGEWLAAMALRVRGFRIVARRYRTPLGEIDLIARRGDLVAVVEVKVRPTLLQAMDAVGVMSQRRIEGAADLWLSRQPDHARLSIRFDLVAVLPWRWPVHVENIFQGR